jgi:hypothetical protein
MKDEDIHNICTAYPTHTPCLELRRRIASSAQKMPSPCRLKLLVSLVLIIADKRSIPEDWLQLALTPGSVHSSGP